MATRYNLLNRMPVKINEVKKGFGLRVPFPEVKFTVATGKITF